MVGWTNDMSVLKFLIFEKREVSRVLHFFKVHLYSNCIVYTIQQCTNQTRMFHRSCAGDAVQRILNLFGLVTVRLSIG